MITIIISVHKRGKFSFKYNLEFQKEKDVLSYIKEKRSFTNECIEEENEWGESIYSFRESFTFNNVDYYFYADA